MLNSFSNDVWQVQSVVNEGSSPEPACPRFFWGVSHIDILCLMMDLSYWNHTPTGENQVFAVNHIVSINHLEKQLPRGSSPQTCKTLISENTPRAKFPWASQGPVTKMPLSWECALFEWTRAAELTLSHPPQTPLWTFIVKNYLKYGRKEKKMKIVIVI